MFIATFWTFFHNRPYFLIGDAGNGAGLGAGFGAGLLYFISFSFHDEIFVMFLLNVPV